MAKQYTIHKIEGNYFLHTPEGTNMFRISEYAFKCLYEKISMNVERTDSGYIYSKKVEA